MKLTNYKVLAVIMSIVILISIFLINPGNHIYDAIVLNYNPVFEGFAEDEFINNENSLRLLKWNKNILFYLNNEFVLFKVVAFDDLYKSRHAEFIKLLSFYYFSIFIVFYINKKDGKKDKYVCSL